jgi:Zinc knuckle
MLHWSESPPIESVLMLAKQYKDTLISTWKSLQHYHPHEPVLSKHAHLTSADDDLQAEINSLHSPYEDDPEDTFHYSSNKQNAVNKDTFSIQNHTWTCRPDLWARYSPKSHNANSVEKTYPYPKDDSVVSQHRPGQKCFACGSENHWVRECPHYGAYSSCLDHKTMWKEHHCYKSPRYKAAYTVMIDACEDEPGFQGWSR